MKRLRAALATATIALALPAVLVTPAHGDTVTAAADNLRTGWYGNQPTLTPAVVGGSSFGQVFSISELALQTTGAIYATGLPPGTNFVGAKQMSVAHALDMSEHTLRNHLTTIYSKLVVHGRLELHLYATRHGLAPEEHAVGKP